MRTTLLLILATAAATAQDEVDPRKAQALRRLETLRVSVDFDRAPLDEAIGFLREVAGMDIIVSAAAREAAPTITLKLKDLPLKSVLRLMLSPAELTVSWRCGVLVVEPLSEAQARLATRLYDIRDLLVRIEDFPAPKMDLSAKPGIRVICFPEDEGPEATSAETILELVKASTGGRSWDEGKASISILSGRLVVTQSGPVHREVAGLLARLRGMR